MARFGETLLPLLSDDGERALVLANEALNSFPPLFARTLLEVFRRKLGLFTEDEGDAALVQDLLNAMGENQADFTQTFRWLSPADMKARDLFLDPSAFDGWVRNWQVRLAREPQYDAARPAAMQAVNPLYIPRNHRVEAALRAAVEDDDFVPFEKLIAVLAKPYEDQPGAAGYAEPPTGDQSRNYRTFCGT